MNDIPPSLGNPYTAMGPPSNHFWGSLYDGLTDVSDAGDVVPALATSWEQAEPTKWLFSLRQDIVFHNGAPFDSQSVVATILYLQSEEAARFLVANEAKNIAGVRALSDYQVEITTRDPDAILPRRLSLIKMIEPGLWAELGASEYARVPVGTGPYAFSHWSNSNNVATLQAVEQEWRRAQDIKTLVFLDVPNTVAREQGLLSGELDLIASVNPDSVASIRQAGFDVQVHPVSQILSIALPNVRDDDSPLKSEAVRQALNYAVDRDGIAQHIFGGLVDAASQGAVAGTVGYNPNVSAYPYDPEKARQLIAGAGYPEGFSFTIAILSAGGGSAQELAYQKVGQDLASVGIAAEIKGLAGPEFLRRFMGNDWGDYDAFSLLWNNEPMRDVGRSLEYFSCLRPQPFFCDEETADIIRASRRESDPATRNEILQQVMARMKSQAPALWLVTTSHLSASRPSVQGVEMGTGGFRFEEMAVNR